MAQCYASILNMVFTWYFSPRIDTDKTTRPHEYTCNEWYQQVELSLNPSVSYDVSAVIMPYQHEP